MLETGIRGRASCPVTQNNTAAAMGSGALLVLATPAVAALVEEAPGKACSLFWRRARARWARCCG